MCGCQQSRGGPAKASAKSTELYAMKAGPPIVKLFNIWHFMSKAALFHSQLCVGHRSASNINAIHTVLIKSSHKNYLQKSNAMRTVLIKSSHKKYLQKN